MTAERPPFAIIVGLQPSYASSAGEQPIAWLAAAAREAASVNGRVIVVGAVEEIDALAAADAQRAGAAVELVPASGLTPELWGVGLRRTKADVVAFSISECTLDSGWASTALRELGTSAAGVGGGLRLGEKATATARAVFFLRYSAFLASSVRERREVHDVAGDNAAYRRESLMRHGTWDHGFWEIEAHRMLRAHGERLMMVPGLSATFGGSPSLRGFVEHRFAHGRQFAQWRSRARPAAAVKIIASSPAVPLVLLARTAQRVRRGGGSVRQLAGCLGPFLTLASAWAAGEARGALDTLRGVPVGGH